MKVKFIIAAMLFLAIAYAGYSVYESATLTGAEKFMRANVEALTLNEPGGDQRYPDRRGKALFCSLYVYTKGSIVVKSEDVRKDLEVSGEYSRTTVSGLKDRCPNNGNGCNPYSCQEVPY
ncbi:hypothetical protein [Butyricimonas paravirosa]